MSNDLASMEGKASLVAEDVSQIRSQVELDTMVLRARRHTSTSHLAAKLTRLVFPAKRSRLGYLEVGG
jgi:hypothetical protein